MVGPKEITFSQIVMDQDGRLNIWSQIKTQNKVSAFSKRLYCDSYNFSVFIRGFDYYVKGGREMDRHPQKLVLKLRSVFHFPK